MTEIMKDLEKEKLGQISDISPKKSTKKIKKKKKLKMKKRELKKFHTKN